ncbi:DegT/DnrJ/EryC1/StrS family aminotransferase [Denitratisoma oestradiolicum]|uniref:Uridine 5'-(Beta-1-threo-pentapyranosyl-4-ulose diphosphate) aminotransferase, PLP-dependent n=1 Tax=Denitratisoma oestradiolicum TaxID=311182 RepID=A0A6S6XWH3_9PROT|nr:DegT/DnrJ/EryC1/StrS aminotransferase family protein [Denitratisoma oestradiolicum]TWO82274.1 aminotransferase DegT [Denitratisoma oestradiolicum]CAB1369227.1 uridine 5'-(beta-1-threo-pentapyranosyl-4-ulose diphosphate) aminotransferase, PLP-dependent [Denitratisoma oestradiolicum]
MNTDFLPFTRPSIDEATIASVTEVLRSGWITSGPKVQAFESALSVLCGGRPVRAFNSGTAALEVALRLANIQAGDEVITTPLTWVATANVILEVGATPVLVDIDPATRNIDLDRVEAAITARTRAIIPVDLAGLPVDRDRLYAIAHTHQLRVVEDAAQSFGASWKGRPIGSTGDFVAFSFHANKNLTTTEGGALVLPADVDAGLCERLRLQGVQRFPDGGMDVDVLGGKWNLTDVAAAVGLGQLKHLDEFTERRRQLARRYFEKIDPTLGLALPPADFSNSNWHMFQPLLPPGTDRGAFIAAMKDQGIGVGVHYPALHLFSLYRNLGFKAGQFPQAENVGARTVTLPLFPAMEDSDVDRVCQALTNALQR